MKLYNNVELPNVGFGTYLIDPVDTKKCCLKALQAGYRHIDTAQGYANEKEVGEAVKESKINRSDIFITSKVLAELKDYASAKQSIDESIERLGLGYIDLMLIHCPQPWAEYRGTNKYYPENKEVWRAMEDAYLEGKLKAIGVSNFNQDDLNNIFEDCRIKPMVNQFYINPIWTDIDLINYSKELGIVVEAYSPIDHGRALNNKTLEEVANKYGVGIAQLCIKYCLQLGLVVLPKAKLFRHIEDNIKLDFTISDSDMKLIYNVK